jgi:predicted Fe-S protein YdhL (DUF1289 family)
VKPQLAIETEERVSRRAAPKANGTVAEGEGTPAGQDAPFADPCINICRMDQDGKFCQGSKRTELEIGGRPRMTEQQKAGVIASIKQRTAPRVTLATRKTS